MPPPPPARTCCGEQSLYVSKPRAGGAGEAHRLCHSPLRLVASTAGVISSRSSGKRHAATLMSAADLLIALRVSAVRPFLYDKYREASVLCEFWGLQAPRNTISFNPQPSTTACGDQKGGVLLLWTMVSQPSQTTLTSTNNTTQHSILHTCSRSGGGC